ncbi:MAG: hypothetical protein M5U34_38565 [Chloroflexi bacterium]|nr:hypothetical protein [Chloroflexota bacterium]
MKAIIFDINGVLVDYDHEATLAALTAVCHPRLISTPKSHPTSSNSWATVA